jgi:hypothetical protein
MSSQFVAEPSLAIFLRAGRSDQEQCEQAGALPVS